MPELDTTQAKTVPETLDSAECIANWIDTDDYDQELGHDYAASFVDGTTLAEVDAVISELATQADAHAELVRSTDNGITIKISRY